MQQFIIFLRAVNVSGKNIIKMDELKKVLADEGFEGIKTYIQSGNVVVNSKQKTDKLSQQISTIIKQHFDLDIVVFTLSLDALKESLNRCPFDLSLPGNKLYFTFLDKEPEAELIKALQSTDHGEEQFAIVDKVLYFYLPEGMANSKMNNNYFEKKLKVNATGRNLNTIQKMIQLAEK